MRGWMEDKPNYLPPVEIGAVMRGTAVGEVVTSRLEGYEPGDLVMGMMGWQEWALGDASLRKLPPGTDPTAALSILGITGITAYYGLLEIGERSLVSGRDPQGGGRGGRALRVLRRRQLPGGDGLLVVLRAGLDLAEQDLRLRSAAEPRASSRGSHR